MRIMFVGDINLGEYYTSFGHGPASYLEHSDVFDKVYPIFEKADFVVGNLEAALTTNNLVPNEPERVVLRGSPKHAPLLKKAGFKVLQVANNHTVQHGKAGFDETIQLLSENGIHAIGVNNQDILVIQSEGKKLGFFAASDVPDNTDKSQDSYQRLDETFLEKIKASVKEVDHLFVMFHWGLEASTSVLDYQKKIINDLTAAGVRGVLGAHPHLFYEIWRTKNTIVAPSLGDFIFDLGWDKRLLQTGILDIEINDEEIVTQVWPIEIMHNGCVPTPTGSPIPLTDHVKLYDLGDNMEGEQARKFRYFFKNILKGNKLLKIKFFARKVFPFLKPNNV